MTGGISLQANVAHVLVIEPWHVSLTTKGAGEFQGPVRKPTPPSQHIRLVRCCAFLGRARDKKKPARMTGGLSLQANVAHVLVIEPWHVSLTTKGAGEFQGPVRKPTPPSQHIRLVRCCAFLGRARDKKKPARMTGGLSLQANVAHVPVIEPWHVSLTT